MITNLIDKERIRAWLVPVTRLIARTGLTPNMLTVMGFGLNAAVGLIIVLGELRWAGAAFVLASIFDMFDGSLARLTNRVTPFGAFLDSNLDRFSEAAVCFGLLLLYTGKGAMVEVLLIYVVIVGSLMVSYSRARAEGLGLKCEVGLLGRPERVAILTLGLLLDWIVPALWVLAIFTNFTALQRIYHVWRLTRK
ncbi:MAG: CDP-alcohol phosphatidyltransferase family protein [Chloroflexi bacterium]|nr:CDP-alcohol phosphatidyltransferase family protein [Chloroflexota bacterium]